MAHQVGGGCVSGGVMVATQASQALVAAVDAGVVVHIAAVLTTQDASGVVLVVMVALSAHDTTGSDSRGDRGVVMVLLVVVMLLVVTNHGRSGGRGDGGHCNLSHLTCLGQHIGGDGTCGLKARAAENRGQNVQVRVRKVQTARSVRGDPEARALGNVCKSQRHVCQDAMGWFALC